MLQTVQSEGISPSTRIVRSIISEATRCFKMTVLVSRLRSRSLAELTRQITPPTKNGYAPPPIS